MTKEKKFIVFTTITSVFVCITTFILYYRHGVAEMEAERNSRHGLPLSPEETGAAAHAQGSTEAQDQKDAAKGKAALYQEYDAAMTGIDKFHTALKLMRATTHSKVMTDEDRSYLKKYFNDETATEDGKKIVLIGIQGMKDGKSIDWLIDSAAAEKSDDMREKIVLILFRIDRPLAILKIDEKSKGDEKHRSVQAVARRLADEK